VIKSLTSLVHLLPAASFGYHGWYQQRSRRKILCNSGLGVQQAFLRSTWFLPRHLRRLDVSDERRRYPMMRGDRKTIGTEEKWFWD
jgi:hypothetical protein